MADDKDEIIGKWTVKVKGWTWEYLFSPGGKVTWRDPLNNENGAGRWTMSSKLINISWSGSSTAESLTRPITPAKQSGWYSSSYYTGKYEMKKVPPAGASDVDPTIANLPFERYVDQFTESRYDLNYKIPPDKSFAFSSIIQLRYLDGVTLELDIIKDFSSMPMSPIAARDLMAHASVGRGGRIFPQVLNFRTTPRLWPARRRVARSGRRSRRFYGIGDHRHGRRPLRSCHACRSNGGSGHPLQQGDATNRARRQTLPGAHPGQHGPSRTRQRTWQPVGEHPIHGRGRHLPRGDDLFAWQWCGCGNRPGHPPGDDPPRRADCPIGRSKTIQNGRQAGQPKLRPPCRPIGQRDRRSRVRRAGKGLDRPSRLHSHPGRRQSLGTIARPVKNQNKPKALTF